MGELASVLFSALTFLVAIPTAVKVFNWIATLYKGSIALNTPMLYAMSSCSCSRSAG
jgi:cytochrome c oxidase subunit 1